MIALWFATVYVENELEDGCLWALQPSLMNQEFNSLFGVSAATAPIVEAASSEAFNSGPVAATPVAVAVGTWETDERIAAQMGTFTIHRNHAPLETQPNSEQWLRRFRIPRESKSKIVRELGALGLRRSTLFPDLVSLAFEVAGTRFIGTGASARIEALPPLTIPEIGHAVDVDENIPPTDGA